MGLICLFIVLTQTLITANTQCPMGCVCDGDKNQWKSVSCTGSHLSSVPNDLHLTVKVLNLSFNDLKEIDNIAMKRFSEIEVLDVSHNPVRNVPDLPRTVTALNFSNNLLTEIPDSLPPHLTVLKLNHNQITVFNVSTICYLQNLRTLFLNNNKIKNVISNPKDGECSVAYLKLTNNKLENIDAHAFSSFKKLKYLDLSRNGIKTVESGTFYDFHDLKYLSLAGNQITSVPEKLPIMEWFDISQNEIVRVSEDQKNDIYPHDVFLIGQNPFHCDCELLWLKEFYDTKKYQLKFLDVNVSMFVPVCITPKSLHNKDWNSLPDKNFICSDSHDTANQEKDNKFILKGLNATINVIGADYLTVEWKLNDVKIRSSDLVLIKIHPFGHKDERKYHSVNLDALKYTIKSLKPATSYIVCTLVVKGMPSKLSMLKEDGFCLEVKTKDDDSELFMVVKNTLQYFVVLLLFLIFIKIGHIGLKCIAHFVYKDKVD